MDSCGSGVGSQPVLKKDLRPVPAVPVRCTGSSRTVTPTSANGVGGGGGSVGEKVKRDGGKEGSIYASYRALPYNTKLVFWACGAMFATLGLLAADKLEELFPARNNKSIRPSTSSSTSAEAEARFITHPEDSTSEGKEKEERKPKLFSISVVDRS
ncbi:uncharacterized protein UTRI_06093 [Ustilago trichophora]|uniref:Uncharacterized protein n=1 Tax=Ustilago trichophora TaxID=86804 RepID=A0A5C3EEQ6_9BASI|nr:uncharacterized protein UTRI_06093 [Ustilago trichophora]